MYQDVCDLVSVGATSQFQEVGDFRVINRPGKPILVVKGEDQVVRAFLNLCRHRDFPLAQAEGDAVANASEFTCAMHLWVYGLDGELKSASHEKLYPDFDKSCRGLIPLKLIERDGMLWVAPVTEAVTPVT